MVGNIIVLNGTSIIIYTESMNFVINKSIVTARRYSVGGYHSVASTYFVMVVLRYYFR